MLLKIIDCMKRFSLFQMLIYARPDDVRGLEMVTTISREFVVVKVDFTS